MKESWGHPKIEVSEDWNGCLLVNPLCPDDLCWLPVVNGRQHQMHCLGTDSWDYRFSLAGSSFYMSKISTTKQGLITEGWQQQLKRSPAEAEFRRQTMDKADFDAIMAYDGDHDDAA
jgi:hypothetical protein